MLRHAVCRMFLDQNSTSCNLLTHSSFTINHSYNSNCFEQVMEKGFSVGVISWRRIIASVSVGTTVLLPTGFQSTDYLLHQLVLSFLCLVTGGKYIQIFITLSIPQMITTHMPKKLNFSRLYVRFVPQSSPVFNQQTWEQVSHYYFELRFNVRSRFVSQCLLYFTII